MKTGWAKAETLSVREKKENKDSGGKRLLQRVTGSESLFCKVQYLLDGINVKLLLIPLFPVHISWLHLEIKTSACEHWENPCSQPQDARECVQFSSVKD